MVQISTTSLILVAAMACNVIPAIARSVDSDEFVR
jgi:hypothetical protein